MSVYSYTHFTDKETEAQNCSRRHRMSQTWGWRELRQSVFRAHCALTISPVTSEPCLPLLTLFVFFLDLGSLPLDSGVGKSCRVWSRSRWQTEALLPVVGESLETGWFSRGLPLACLDWSTWQFYSYCIEKWGSVNIIPPRRVRTGSC